MLEGVITDTSRNVIAIVRARILSICWRYSKNNASRMFSKKSPQAVWCEAIECWFPTKQRWLKTEIDVNIWRYYKMSITFNNESAIHSDLPRLVDKANSTGFVPQTASGTSNVWSLLPTGHARSSAKKPGLLMIMYRVAQNKPDYIYIYIVYTVWIIRFILRHPVQCSCLLDYIVCNSDYDSEIFTQPQYVWQWRWQYG